jgi:putative transposase
MRDLLLLAIHLLVTLAKLLRPGGVRAVAAESLLLKHQLVISNRSRQRAPNLTSRDRFVLGSTTLFVSPRRIPKLSAMLKPATLLQFHKALVDRKCGLLFSSSSNRRKPGPKGPSTELIVAIVEMKRRNPKFGGVRIAQQIAHAFGIELDKDVVRLILAKHSFIGHTKDSLWSIDLLRCESVLLCSHWVMLVMDVFTRRLVGFGVERANIDGLSVCWMFNHAVAGQPLPKHLSTDHDPLFRFHRWLANLRVIEIEEVKSVPSVPVSHPFIERLIGTVRREYLDRVFFWNAVDLTRKLEAFRDYYNASRVHRSLDGTTPAQRADASSPALPRLIITLGSSIVVGCFRPRSSPNHEFATHTRKLEEFRYYYNEHRVHRSLDGNTPAQRAGASSPAPAALDRHAWQQHCRGLFHTPIPA